MNSQLTSESIENLLKIKNVCNNFMQNSNNSDELIELKRLINNSTPIAVRTVEPQIFAIFYPILKEVSGNKTNSTITIRLRHALVDTFTALFGKIVIEKSALFYNIYGFLLHELCDIRKHEVNDIPEEYKLSIIECTIALSQALSMDLVREIYIKENAPRFSHMLLIMLKVAKTDQFKQLQILSLNCLMAITRVLNDDDFNDLVIRDQIADMLMFFIPGIASQLKDVCLSDEKIGHKVPMTALKAWSRIVALQMQDYNASDNKTIINYEKFKKNVRESKWKNENEFKEYLKQTKRTPEWYQETDKNLCKIIIELTKLTHHTHEKVRLELANMIELLINNCIDTMPNSIQQLIVIGIILSEDSNDLIRNKCRTILEELSTKLNSNRFQHLLDNLEESFYNAIISLPRKFNSIDEGEQLAALNLLLGYINLFKRHNLISILYSFTYLDQLLSTLIHIAEFDKSDVSLSEDYTSPDFEPIVKVQMPWKKFRYFKDDLIWKKIEEICCLLGKYGGGDIVCDFLLNKFDKRTEHIKEVTFLLNGLISGLSDEDYNLIKNILTTYTDKNNWYLPLQVMIDDEGYEHTFGDVQSNILQVCLLVEGVGIVALTLKQKFQQFLLTNLYLVIERAGSNHPLIRNAGMLALSNISKACNYQDIQDLINKNLDYFSFYLGRQLRKSQLKENALNVLTTIMKYNSSYVQMATMELITDFLDKSDREINSLLHLRLFKTFIKSLYNWLDIEIVIPPLKSKLQKQQELEDFQVSNIDYNQSFSDDIMGKSAEELYKEDMKKNRKQLEEDENDFDDQQYEKPKPPHIIEVTGQILKEVLNTLPSKERNKKLLVLEILKDGIEILKDWEDELLPIVHLIWGPLVDRFKEDDHLIINHSFQLLVTLARLSQQFIRLRTTKEVLPELLKLLDQLSQQSYLKDRGAAYRFTQSYKLQLNLLENLARFVIDLDMLDEHIQKIIEIVYKYLSDKQPVPLQTAAVDFFKILRFYDPAMIEDKLKGWLIDNTNTEFTKNLKLVENYENET